MRREGLTVFAADVLELGGIASREEEDAAVDGDDEGTEGDDLETVDLALVEGIDSEVDEDRNEEKDEQHQRLEHRALRGEEDRNERNHHLPHTHERFPVVGVASVAVVEEAELLFDWGFLKSGAIATQQEG